MALRSGTITAITFCTLVAACGGGGGGDNGPGNAQLQNIGGNSPPGNNDGTGSPAFAVDATARFDLPSNLYIDNAGNLYVREFFRPALRKIAPNGDVSTMPEQYNNAAAIDKLGNFYTLESFDSDDINGRDREDIYQVRPDGTRKLFYSFVQTPGATVLDQLNTDVAGKVHLLAQYRQQYFVLELDADTPSQAILMGDGGFAEANPEVGRLLYSTGTFGGVFDFSLDPQSNLAMAKYGPSDGTETISFVPRAAQPANGLQGTPPGVTQPSIPLQNSVNVKYDSAGNLYVRDSLFTPIPGDPNTPDDDTSTITQYRLRKVAPDGTVTTVLDNLPAEGSQAPAETPITLGGMAADTNGNLYVADPKRHAVYKITASGQVSLYAGKPDEAGSSD
jgi:hypothetical protein